MKKVMEFLEIPRNFMELYDTEFSGILANSARNTDQTEVKKNRRNSVDTLKGIRHACPFVHTDGFGRGDNLLEIQPVFQYLFLQWLVATPDAAEEQLILSLQLASTHS